MSDLQARTQLRRLTQAALPGLLELAHLAGWNQTLADVERMFHFAPGGAFGLWRNGKLLSTTMAFPYGTELGWLAMVLTHPDERGKGYAGLVFERAVAWLRDQGVLWMKLDASNFGQPLYANRGFVPETRMERRLLGGDAPRPLSPRGVASGGTADFPLELDKKGFGGDRERLLRMLSRLPGVQVATLPGGTGYAMLRPGANAWQLGPMVCDGPQSGRALLQWALATTIGEALFWDLDVGNLHAAALADEYGFTTQRELVRMALPGVENPPSFGGHPQLVYAIAGFDFG